MDITFRQILFAAVFIAVLLLVEGIYLLARGSNRRELAANRRMKLANSKDANVLNPTIMRQQIIGGPFSRWILSFFPNLANKFWVANVKTTPGTALLFASMAVVALFFTLRFALLAPIWISLATAVVIGFGVPFLLLNIAVDKQRKQFSAQLPDAINLISRGLQAGHPVPVAFGLVAREMGDPIGAEFGHVLDEINFGRDRDLALRDVAKKFPDPDFQFFLAAVEMQRETGGNLVGILDNLTKIIRDRSHMRKKAWAVSAEGRLTCLIVGALPYLLLAYFLLTNPSFILDVVDHPMFWPFMGGAWVLWLIGIIWIWRMVNFKV